MPGPDFAYLRGQLIGADATISTPFGERLMVYGDYTASGRCLGFIERYLQRLQRFYANTHTEDGHCGRSMTRLLHQAEAEIKRSVNAGERGRIIAIGTGATGAIDKFQQLIGVALPPATRQNLETLLAGFFGLPRLQAFRAFLNEHQPVVFVGPYEHHSNEISWRQNLATVVEVDLDDQGDIDLAHLDRLLQKPEFSGRLLIGSFSAASNVTGLRSPVHDIARIMHRYGGIACFDYAACAPYVKIDMSPPAEGEDASLDAVFISPHKFLGGPGSSGILVFNERIYHRELPPSVSAGGTVDYVSPRDQDYIEAIEEREKAGTPGVLQILKAALAIQLKDRVTVEAIETRERALLERALGRWSNNPRVSILGNPDPDRRISIISFNLQGRAGQYLHPKFVTTLLNDLFGIQTRAGCSCAGPYGHRLLGINDKESERYRRWIRKGYSGLKPGWCRISLHYVMDDLEVDYILDAVDFVAEHGVRFLPLYRFDLLTGNWQHRADPVDLEDFSLNVALECGQDTSTPLSWAERRAAYQLAMEEALNRSLQLERQGPFKAFKLAGIPGQLQFFTLPEVSIDPAIPGAAGATPREVLPSAG